MTRRPPSWIALVIAATAVAPATAGAHSLVRPAGAVVSYISADATSLNTLVVRPNGARIEFRYRTVVTPTGRTKRTRNRSLSIGVR